MAIGTWTGPVQAVYTPNRSQHQSLLAACVSNCTAKLCASLWNAIPNVLIVTLLQNVQCPIQGSMKRTAQVNVKMTEEDFRLLRRAAEKKWPDAVLTNSGIVLALARIAARQTLGKKKC